MTIPLLGPVSLTGFQHIWWLVLFVVVVLGLIGLYAFAQAARRRRLQQFANAELLDSVAPKRPTVWRHVPAVLLAIALVLCTIALAGPTYDQRLPRNRAVVMLTIDVSQSMRATDVEPRPAGSRSGSVQEVRRRADPGHQPGRDRLCRHGHGDGFADHEPGREQARHRQSAGGRPHRHR